MHLALSDPAFVDPVIDLLAELAGAGSAPELSLNPLILVGAPQSGNGPTDHRKGTKPDSGGVRPVPDWGAPTSMSGFRLSIGTDRVALLLAEQGIEVHGIDFSE